jgi:rubrerythrin
MVPAGGYTAQELLAAAMEIERNSENNYRALAERVSDESVRSVFAKLALQEAGHTKYLEQIQEFSRKARGWPQHSDMPEELLATLDAILFSQIKDVDPQSFASEEQALLTGINLEVDAIASYKGLSSMAKDQSGRNTFDHLVDWEQEHLFILNYWLGLIRK